MDEPERINPDIRYFCHQCRETLLPTQDYTCSLCGSGFIEEINTFDEMADGNDQPLHEVFSELNGPSTSDSAQSPNFAALFSQLLNTDVRSLIAGPRMGGSFDFSNLPFLQIMYGNINDYAWGPEGLDAIVTQLLNQFESSGPPPMTKTEIESLPEVKITQEQVDANLQCTVCMEDYVLDEKVKQLKCQHVFHDSCIVPWLEMHGTCPICRQELSEQTENSASSDAVILQTNFLNATPHQIAAQLNRQRQESSRPESQQSSQPNEPDAQNNLLRAGNQPTAEQSSSNSNQANSNNGSESSNQRSSQNYLDHEIEDLD